MFGDLQNRDIIIKIGKHNLTVYGDSIQNTHTLHYKPTPPSTKFVFEHTITIRCDIIACIKTVLKYT